MDSDKFYVATSAESLAALKEIGVNVFSFDQKKGSKPLTGNDVVIVVDATEQGFEHALKRARELYGMARSVSYKFLAPVNGGSVLPHHIAYGEGMAEFVKRIGDNAFARELFDADPEVAVTDIAMLYERLLYSSGAFAANHKQASYLIDDVVLRSYFYSLTAPTSHGKTSIALYLALMVAQGKKVCGHETERCRVLYFAGENEVDVAARWILLCEQHALEPKDVDVLFMPSLQTLSDELFQRRLITEVKRHGDVGLMFVDTSAAYSEMEDSNADMQILEHAKVLRSFIKKLPGNPTVIVLCHPVKTPNMDSLLPKGGGAFLNEVDGNLVCKMQSGTMLVDLHWHGKIRGADFEPLSFELRSKTSDKLKTPKGKLIPTVYATEVSETERELITGQSKDDQDTLLLVLLKHPGASQSELAAACQWFQTDGKPYKVKVGRLLEKVLQPRNLVEKDRQEKWKLTTRGEQEAKALEAVKNG